MARGAFVKNLNKRQNRLPKIWIRVVHGSRGDEAQLFLAARCLPFQKPQPSDARRSNSSRKRRWIGTANDANHAKSQTESLRNAAFRRQARGSLHGCRVNAAFRSRRKMLILARSAAVSSRPAAAARQNQRDPLIASVRRLVRRTQPRSKIRMARSASILLASFKAKSACPRNTPAGRQRSRVCPAISSRCAGRALS